MLKGLIINYIVGAMAGGRHFTTYDKCERPKQSIAQYIKNFDLFYKRLKHSFFRCFGI